MTWSREAPGGGFHIGGRVPKRSGRPRERSPCGAGRSDGERAGSRRVPKRRGGGPATDEALPERAGDARRLREGARAGPEASARQRNRRGSVEEGIGSLSAVSGRFRCAKSRRCAFARGCRRALPDRCGALIAPARFTRAPSTFGRLAYVARWRDSSVPHRVGRLSRCQKRAKRRCGLAIPRFCQICP